MNTTQRYGKPLTVILSDGLKPVNGRTAQEWATARHLAADAALNADQSEIDALDAASYSLFNIVAPFRLKTSA